MEIYHRQGQHTKFTAVRCDDTQDAQKVTTRFYSDIFSTSVTTHLWVTRFWW